jgi:hypothetical protein
MNLGSSSGGRWRLSGRVVCIFFAVDASISTIAASIVHLPRTTLPAPGPLGIALAARWPLDGMAARQEIFHDPDSGAMMLAQARSDRFAIAGSWCRSSCRRTFSMTNAASRMETRMAMSPLNPLPALV